MDCGYGALTEDRVAEANELLERATDLMTPDDAPYWLALLWTNVGLARLLAGEPEAYLQRRRRLPRLCIRGGLDVGAAVSYTHL